jgi:hypothetical protein
VDVDQLAGARVDMIMPRARLSLEYVPRLTFTDVFYDVSVDLLHNAELSANFDWKHVRLSLIERAAYGTRTYTAVPAQEQPDIVITDTGASIIPITSQPVDYGSSDTAATLTLTLSRRSELDVAGGYLFDGGLDAESRRVIPFVHGPRARLEWRYQATRQDSIGSGVEGERLYTETVLENRDLRSDLVRWRETWSRQWLPNTTTQFSAGVVVARSTPVLDDYEYYAIGGATFGQRMKAGKGAQYFDIDTSAQVDVLIDRLTGLPDQRLDIGLTGTWTKLPYEVYATLGQTQSLRALEFNALALYYGEVGGTYQWTRALFWEAGFRGAYQTVDAPTTLAAANAAEGFNWVLFVALQAQTDLFEEREVSRDETEDEDP